MSDINPGTLGAPIVTAGSATNALGIAAGSTQETAEQLYGYLAVYLNLPEVGPLLQRAAVEGWSPQKLESELNKTDWWKNSQESSRVFDAKWETDRGSVMAQIAQQAATLRSELTELGVTIDDSRLFDIAKQSLRLNWSPEQTKAAMDSELARKPDILMSKVGTDFKALVGQYGVELSDPVLQQKVAHAISGVQSPEMFREYLVRMAKSRFQDEDLARALDAGETVAQFYDPYRQRAAARLGINPDTIDLSDPKWFAAFQGRDPKDGHIRAMTVNEWDEYMKTNPIYGYDQTPQAKQDAYAFADQIGTIFGRKG